MNKVNKALNEYIYKGKEGGMEPKEGLSMSRDELVSYCKKYSINFNKLSYDEILVQIYKNELAFRELDHKMNKTYYPNYIEEEKEEKQILEDGNYGVY